MALRFVGQDSRKDRPKRRNLKSLCESSAQSQFLNFTVEDKILGGPAKTATRKLVNLVSAAQCWRKLEFRPIDC